MPGKGDLQMKEYEVVHEIFNECANNQMRDVFIEEVPIDDLEEYVRKHHEKERDFTFEREDLAFAAIHLYGDLRWKNFLNGNTVS